MLSETNNFIFLRLSGGNKLMIIRKNSYEVLISLSWIEKGLAGIIKFFSIFSNIMF